MRVNIEHGIDGAKLAVSRGDAIIIIDTIRASTTYVNAFGSGAKRIVPCSSQDHLNLKSLDYKNALKSGERLCKKIEGYDLGSSPEEMFNADLEGRIILSSTTNGSKMVVASSGSFLVVMGSFCNASSVVDFFSDKDCNITLICSGRLGDPVIEDDICAEYIKHKFENPNEDFRLSSDEIVFECSKSPSYEMLKSAGLENDFNFCMNIDSHTIVPVLDSDGFILP
jgi:2-phosphosulfolactate phosphatase|tara:strand:+ start:10274 stop:10948 length:675 start_codon:yes stop_codon:yes gene_type:complete